MFTGIIERKLSVISVTDANGIRRMSVAAPWSDVKYGESIAINGCCLTVAAMDTEVSTATLLSFDIIPETLDKTNLGAIHAGDEVNAERSLRVGDRIDGHFVQGHIDGLARLTEVSTADDEWRLTLQAPADLAKYLVPKGSICIDGVSLTLAKVDGQLFQVALIPTTLQITTLATRQPGWCFNLEADVFSKTIVSYLQRMGKI